MIVIVFEVFKSEKFLILPWASTSANEGLVLVALLSRSSPFFIECGIQSTFTNRQLRTNRRDNWKVAFSFEKAFHFQKFWCMDWREVRHCFVLSELEMNSKVQSGLPPCLTGFFSELSSPTARMAGLESVRKSGAMKLNTPFKDRLSIVLWSNTVRSDFRTDFRLKSWTSPVIFLLSLLNLFEVYRSVRFTCNVLTCVLNTWNNNWYSLFSVPRHCSRVTLCSGSIVDALIFSLSKRSNKAVLFLSAHLMAAFIKLLAARCSNTCCAVFDWFISRALSPLSWLLLWQDRAKVFCCCHV